MPLVAIINTVGIPGSGKSHCARNLSAQVDCYKKTVAENTGKFLARYAVFIGTESKLVNQRDKRYKLISISLLCV